MKEQNVTRIFEKTINGTIRDSCSFSKDGSKLAYLYVPLKRETEQIISVTNLKQMKETIINKSPIESNTISTLNDFTWINNEKLLITISTTKDDLLENSCWIYDLAYNTFN